MCLSVDQPSCCPMLFFFITCCFSFLLFHKSLALKPLPPWPHDMRLLSLWFWRDSPFLSIAKFVRTTILCNILSLFASRMFAKNKASKADRVEWTSQMSVLDMPDLVLECILEKLPPEGLYRMSSVCTSLREMCMSDHLWEKHLNDKWGRVIGPVAYRQWQSHMASRKGSVFGDDDQGNGLMGYLASLWPVALIRSGFGSFSKKRDFAPMDSIMYWYFALQSGKFRFPAQVYNRENGHVGFMLSCYDAELSYDLLTDTFEARYPPHGRRPVATETGITWDRVRASPVDTSPHDLHISDCLNELQPGNHIEIQWRRNKEFPYGWWYGVVGHLETCDGNTTYCQCRDNDALVLEFNHYAHDSRWRRMTISRRDHQEEGNEAGGFYGGIRKLNSGKEISTWKKFWPTQILE